MNMYKYILYILKSVTASLFCVKPVPTAHIIFTLVHRKNNLYCYMTYIIENY